MSRDVLDAIRDDLANFAVGLVERVDGAGSKVRGSGVLVSIEGRRGILTCGHVAEKYNDLPRIGLVRFVAGTRQNRTVDIDDAHHIIMESNDEWTETDLDLAFTYLNPEVADKVAVQSVFLNIEKNRSRIEAERPAGCFPVDIMFGLVAEYSEAPFVENRTFVSPMRAVIYSGKLHSDENGLVRFQTSEAVPENLPKDFGGLSGSGLWRVYVEDRGAGDFAIVQKQLWGITSWQMDRRNNTGAVAGQGWDRIEQALIAAVRDNLRF